MSTKLKQAMETAVSELQKYADDLDAKGVEMDGEVQAELLRRMNAVKDAKKAYETDAEIQGTLASAKAFMSGLAGEQEAEQSAKQHVGSFLQPTPGQVKSFGELFVESDAYKDFHKSFVRGGVVPDALKGIQSGQFSADMKALVTGTSATSAGALVTPDRMPGVTDLAPLREPTMRDLVTVSTTDSDVVEFARIVSKTNNAAGVAEATTADMPTAPGTAGALVNATGGGYKPESGMVLEKVTAAVKTIAHWIPVTKRAVADAGQIRTLIDVFLREGLVEKLDSQMLVGDGSGENFRGILNTVGIGTVGSAGTDIDAVVDAIRTVRNARIGRPNGLVIHPNDWYSTGFLLAKDGVNGGYLIGDPRASVDQLQMLWGLKVVVTDAITENTALVGDFRYAALWEREGVNVMVADQHADFFIRNLLAILAEMRAAFGVLAPKAFCTISAV